MTVSRRTLVKGSAWSVPAVAVATAAPALAASGPIQLVGRMPSFAQRVVVTNSISETTDDGLCTTHLIVNSQITGYTDLQRWRYGYVNNQVVKEKGTNASADGAAMIRLVGNGVDEHVTITNVKITFGYTVAPIKGYKGLFVRHRPEKYEAIVDASKKWSAPDLTNKNVTYTVAQFDASKTSSSAPTPADDLHFPTYTSTISSPETKLATDTSKAVGGVATPALYVDVPFMWSNHKDYLENTMKVNAYEVDGTCSGVKKGKDKVTGIALYQYAHFEVTYTKYGQSHTLTDTVVNGGHIN